MSAGFHRRQTTLRELHPNMTGAGNAAHFKMLAGQQINAALSYIARAEQCKPGSTHEALTHVAAALSELQRSGSVSALETKSDEEE